MGVEKTLILIIICFGILRTCDKVIYLAFNSWYVVITGNVKDDDDDDNDDVSCGRILS